MQENTLICFVTGFYPAPVNVSWTRNEEEVTEGTSTGVPYPNKEGTFTQISRLAFVPQQGDIYSCRVQHLYMTDPDTRMWSENECYYCSVIITGGQMAFTCLHVCSCRGEAAWSWTCCLLWTGSDLGSPRGRCWDLLPHQRERVQMIQMSSSGSLFYSSSSVLTKITAHVDTCWMIFSDVCVF